MDMIKILAITGGIPWYLEQINPHITIDDNIKSLCFKANGLFVNEYDRIFHDLFYNKGAIYKKIVDRLATGMVTLSELRQDLAYSKSGSLTQYLKNLITAGFISKHASWSFKTEKIKKHHLYRLNDNYLRFYLKYIEPNLTKIAANYYQDLVLSQLPAWDTIMGFQVENLLLNNRRLLIQALGIAPSEIVADNPYIQKANNNQQGCQVDYLVQTRFKTLYLCEFKFSRKDLGIEVIDSMQEKIAKFYAPRGFGVVPVLVHSGEVRDEVYLQNFFYRIIDIADLLK